MNQYLPKGICLFALVHALKHQIHLYVLHNLILRVENVNFMTNSALKLVWVGFTAHKEVIDKTLLSCESYVAVSAREGQALWTFNHVFLNHHTQLALKFLRKLIERLCSITVLHSELNCHQLCHFFYF